jgi:hypothetical protein
MIWIAVVFFVSLMLFLFYIFLIRSQQVASFRIRYLREESDFLMRTMWIDDEGGIFARFDSLPSFDVMVWKFWIPVKMFYQSLSLFYDMSKVKDFYTDEEISLLKGFVDQTKTEINDLVKEIRAK